MSTLLTIDCDGVLSATAESILAYNKYQIKGIPAAIEDLTDHWFHKIPKFGLSLDEAIDIRYSFYEQADHTTLFPEPHAVSVIQQLHKRGYRLVVLTARIDAWKPQTLAWIEYYFPDIFEEVIFTNDLTEKAQKKGAISSTLGAALHIDDHVEYAACTCAHGVPTYLFSKPWNAAYIPEHELMTRVSGRKEVLDLLE